MPKLFPAYRVLAFVVGVLLAVATAGSLCKYLLSDGSTLQQLGEQGWVVWVTHGWIYIVYVIVAFLLAHDQRWSIRFTLLMLLAGVVPFLIFWVEHKVAQRVLGERVASPA